MEAPGNSPGGGASPCGDCTSDRDGLDAIDAILDDLDNAVVDQSTPPLSSFQQLSTNTDAPFRARVVGRIRSSDPSSIRSVRKFGGVYIKQRANGRYFTHVILPKIVKTDIRRMYPQIFCNVENSSDQSMLMSFLNFFTFPDAIYDNVVHDPIAGARHFSLMGSLQAGQFLTRLREVTPDKTCRVLASRVRARSDGTGEVECVLELIGTVLVRLGSEMSHASPSVQRLVELYGAVVQRALAQDEASTSIVACSVKTPAAVQRVDVNTTLLISMVTTATMKFQLDARNIIKHVYLEKAAPTVDIRYA